MCFLLVYFLNECLEGHNCSSQLSPKLARDCHRWPKVHKLLADDLTIERRVELDKSGLV